MRRFSRLAVLAALVLNASVPAVTRGEPADTGVWRNYDFTPGRTIWAATDFTSERVGRFPASQLEFVKGNMQIVSRNGANVLEVSAPSVFRLKLKEPLPPDFSLEFDAQVGAPNLAINVFFTPLTTGLAQFPNHYLSIWQRSGLYFKGQGVSAISGAWKLHQSLNPVKFQADGEYALLYVGSERAGNLPKATIARSNQIEFQINATDKNRAYLKDIVVGVGLDKLYDALKAKGEFTTHGIYFDSDSHEIRPESTPTLEELRETLAGHPELKITIEGHTDSRGEDAHNQALSGRRAESVKQHLVANGIAADRIRTVGHGSTKPVADNETPRGRSENRRVVVRLDS